MNKLYSRINWENEVTPLNESNLNKMDGALNDLDNRVIEQSNLKADKADINSTIVNVNIDENTGIITFTRYNGTTIKFDTKLEKIVTTVRYDSDKQQIVLVLEDGSELQIDVSALITQYEFEDSATIRFSVVGGKVSASIINGSIKESMLDSSIMAKIAVYVSNSAQNATTAVNSASEAKTAANEAKASADAAAESEANAKIYAENAKAIAGVGIATADTAGLMRGGDNYVDESGALVLTRETTDSTLLNSYAGGLKINSISGRNMQLSTTGKNMWNPNGFTDVVIDEAGTTKRGIKIDVPGTYTFSFSSKGTDAIYYVYYSEIAGFTSRKEITESITTTFPEYEYFIIYADSDTILQTLVEPQLEVGLVATAYEPFTGGELSPSPAYPQETESAVVSEIKTTGAQLLDAQNIYYNSGLGVTATLENGIITLNGTATDTVDVYVIRHDVNVSVADFVNKNVGSYYLSNDLGLSNYFLDTKGLYSPNAMTVTEDTFLKAAFVRIAKGKTFSNTPLKIMLNKGDTALPWRGYEENASTLSEPITLNGIGEAKDRIVGQGGMWNIERKLKEVVLDGSENWTKSATSDVNRYILILSDVLADLNCNFICSQAQKVNTTLSTEYNVAFITQYKQFAINAEFSTLEEWKAHLKAFPITLVYELATSTFEELPEVDQIALHSLQTYADVTYVVTDSEVEPVIEVEYGTSKVGAYTLENYNGMKRNEIKINALMELTNDLSAAVVAESEG